MPIINIKEQKNSLRAKHKKIRTACPKEIRAALDKTLFEKFVDLKEYYDRFLEQFGGTTAGLCYSRCIEQKLPHGIYDKAVDIIITEKFTNDTRNVFEKGMV